MILFYSGTGNSRFVANKLAELLGESVIDLGAHIKNNVESHFENFDRLIFVYPTYAGRMPVFLSKYLSKQKYKENAEAYFVTTCGASGGNQFKNLKTFCDNLNIRFKNFMWVVMPENYIALFKAPDKNKAKVIINKALPTINVIAQRIQHQDNAKHISGFNKSIYNDVFYKIIVSAKGFYVEEGCVGCGKCVDNCVMNNVRLVNDKPVWNDGCTHCMACINYCPTQSIQYKRSTKNKIRYKFEE